MDKGNNTNGNGSSAADKLDLLVVFSQIKKHTKLYCIVVPIAAVIGLVIAFSMPRYYECDVKLAPETSAEGGGLSSLMTQFGIGAGANSDDAISPNLYPDLMESQEFVVSLFPVHVKSKDGKIDTDYYTYLEKHQKAAWWDKIKNGLFGLFTKKETGGKGGPLNYKMLSKTQFEIVQNISGHIVYDYDKKTGVISITVTDQDPLIAATIADTVSSRLQVFITDYRTKKARVDLEYSQKIWQEAKEEYERAAQIYSASLDSDWDLVEETSKLQQKKLQNDMDMKYQAFSALNTKLQAAKVKVQEDTPAFSMLQRPTVPVLPEGPRRGMITIAFFILGFIVTTIYVLAKETKVSK